MEITYSKFSEWATSFSGCDGGDPNAKVWLSGIEWGGGDDEAYYGDKLPREIGNGSYQPPKRYDWKDSLTYPYGRSFAKLYAAMQGRDVASYREIGDYDGSEVFKLNLYPIAFRNTDDQLWRKHGLERLTGFKDKYLYQAWCMLHRFPAFSEKLREHSPEIIIGTGVTCLSEFFLCFGRHMGREERIQSTQVSSENGGNTQERTIYWSKISDKTHLFVIPFFSGAGGLNSDELLQKTGDLIRSETDFSVAR